MNINYALLGYLAVLILLFILGTVGPEKHRTRFQLYTFILLAVSIAVFAGMAWITHQQIVTAAIAPG
jgi:hypothetical protein